MFYDLSLMFYNEENGTQKEKKKTKKRKEKETRPFPNWEIW